MKIEILVFVHSDENGYPSEWHFTDLSCEAMDYSLLEHMMSTNAQDELDTFEEMSLDKWTRCNVWWEHETPDYEAGLSGGWYIEDVEYIEVVENMT